MSYTKPPPITISDRIRNMAPQTDISLRGGNLRSIRSLLVRINYEGNGEYVCELEGKNVRVWRLA